MSLFTKEVVSEKTIIIWLFLTAASSIACILASSIVVYAMYGCWPLARSSMGGSACLSRVEPQFLSFLPILLGIIIGTAATYKMTKK